MARGADPDVEGRGGQGEGEDAHPADGEPARVGACPGGSGARGGEGEPDGGIDQNEDKREWRSARGTTAERGADKGERGNEREIAAEAVGGRAGLGGSGGAEDSDRSEKEEPREDAEGGAEQGVAREEPEDRAPEPLGEIALRSEVSGGERETGGRTNGGKAGKQGCCSHLGGPSGYGVGSPQGG